MEIWVIEKPILLSMLRVLMHLHVSCIWIVLGSVATFMYACDLYFVLKNYWREKKIVNKSKVR